jgi:excisionase family DNA binding protein
MKNRIKETHLSELMTLEELASYLRVTKKTVYRMLEKDSIPATRIGHLWRFEKSLIDAWLRQSSRKAVASILVIDDDETICSLFKDTLEDAGHTVTVVDESNMGIEVIKEQNFDIVFLDLKMPIIDGSEIFRQIKIDKPDLPVTIITGYPDSDLMMKALAYGPLGIMNKPFNSSEILSAVDNYLRFGMTK